MFKEMTPEKIWEAQQGNSLWDDAEKGIAIARAAHLNALKQVKDWAGMQCKHGGKNKECPDSWQQFKEEIKRLEETK